MFGWLKRTPLETHAPREVADLLARKAIHLIDVREKAEWAQGHIQGATLLPLSQLASHLAEVPTDKPVVFYCVFGKRSESAVAAAAKAGLAKVSHMDGGIKAWQADGLPVVR